MPIDRDEIRDWLEASCPPEMRAPTRGDEDICRGGKRWPFQSPAQKLWFERRRARGFWTAFCSGAPRCFEWAGWSVAPRSVGVHADDMAPRFVGVDADAPMVGDLFSGFGPDTPSIAVALHPINPLETARSRSGTPPFTHY